MIARSPAPWSHRYNATQVINFSKLKKLRRMLWEQAACCLFIKAMALELFKKFQTHACTFWIVISSWKIDKVTTCRSTARAVQKCFILWSINWSQLSAMNEPCSESTGKMELIKSICERLQSHLLSKWRCHVDYENSNEKKKQKNRSKRRLIILAFHFMLQLMFSISSGYFMPSDWNQLKWRKGFLFNHQSFFAHI